MNIKKNKIITLASSIFIALNAITGGVAGWYFVGNTNKTVNGGIYIVPRIFNEITARVDSFDIKDTRICAHRDQTEEEYSVGNGDLSSYFNVVYDGETLTNSEIKSKIDSGNLIFSYSGNLKRNGAVITTNNKSKSLAEGKREASISLKFNGDETSLTSINGTTTVYERSWNEKEVYIKEYNGNTDWGSKYYTTYAQKDENYHYHYWEQSGKYYYKDDGYDYYCSVCNDLLRHTGQESYYKHDSRTGYDHERHSFDKEDFYNYYCDICNRSASSSELGNPCGKVSYSTCNGNLFKSTDYCGGQKESYSHSCGGTLEKKQEGANIFFAVCSFCGYKTPASSDDLLYGTSCPKTINEYKCSKCGTTSSTYGTCMQSITTYVCSKDSSHKHDSPGYCTTMVTLTCHGTIIKSLDHTTFTCKECGYVKQS